MRRQQLPSDVSHLEVLRARRDSFTPFRLLLYSSCDPVFSSKVSSSNAASTPTQAATAAAGAAGTASSAPAQADLDLFGESGSAAKAEDAAKKPLSKDSILSLYGTNSMSQPAAAGEGGVKGGQQAPWLFVLVSVLSYL